MKGSGHRRRSSTSRRYGSRQGDCIDDGIIWQILGSRLHDEEGEVPDYSHEQR